MRLRLLAPRYWLTWAGLGLLRLIAFLPYSAIVWLGRGLGTVLRHLPISFAHTARRNIELCLPELSPEERAHLLNRPPKNEVIAYAFERFRVGWGGRGIPRDDIRAFIAALKNNECVWYAPDQAYRKKGAEMVPLFGIPAASNTLTSRLARMTGAPVLPYFFHRLPGTQGYVGVIHPPLENFPGDCAASDTARFYRMIEAQVRLAPEQYLWIHRRFKGLSADYPDYYGRQAPRQSTP